MRHIDVSPRLFQTLFSLLLGLAALLMVLRGAIHLISPSYNVASEAICLYGALNVSEGKSLFPPASFHPYHIHVHSPLATLTSGMLARWSGLTSIHSRVILIRLFSALAFAGILVLLKTRLWRPLALGNRETILLLILLAPKFSDYWTSARNDLISLFFELAALSFFLASNGKRKHIGFFFFILSAVAAVYSRQTAVGIFGGVVLYLLSQRNWKMAAIAIALFSFIVVGLGFVGQVVTNGAFLEHVLLVNIRRGLRPLDWSFFDASLISFLGSYILFGILAVRGLIGSWREKSSHLALCCLLTTTFVGTVVFLRPGGDVNYFFSAMLVASYFAGLGLLKALPSFDRQRWLAAGVVIQIAGVAGLTGIKDLSAWREGEFPYAQAAQWLRANYAPYGLVLGSRAATLSVHTRGWAFHGPDFTANSFSALHAKMGFDWVTDDIQRWVEKGSLGSVVIAQDGCAAAPVVPPEKFRPHPFFGDSLTSFQFKEAPYSWLCIYTQAAALPLQQGVSHRL